MTHFVTLGLAAWLHVLKNTPKCKQEQSIPVTIIHPFFSDGMEYRVYQPDRETETEEQGLLA